MLSKISNHRVKLFWVAMILLIGAAFAAWQVMPVQAQNPSGDLRIEPVTAYNLVVDSNVLTPATYAPTSAMLSARFCNDGDDDLTDVVAYIGDYLNNKPGKYPVRNSASFAGLHDHLLNTGPYFLVHEGGSAGAAEAVRYIGTLEPGECKTQYWLVSYPRKSNGPGPEYVMNAGGTSVTGGSIGPEDDLFLFYDFWAKANDGGVPLTADVRRRVTMRNEISAAANKIWPNTTSKVPDEYLTLIGATLGWDTLTPGGGDAGLPGTVFSTQGFWYDFGNIGAGFDNNGDLVPDRNAWVQPVGDPGAYDAGCFRLYRTYGIVIIKLNDGTEKLIPFEDQLYFENVPENNTGAVGLVYYEYISLDGVCTGALTPYQEVASGNDNEKFNGDFGYSIPEATTQDPSAKLPMDKSVDLALVSLPGTLTYTIEITNTAAISVGLPEYGMPLVISDTIPAGTTYVAGSATSSNNPPAPNTFNVKFSTDYGVTWTSIEPAAASVTTIQWWLSGMFEPDTAGYARYRVSVPGTYTQPIVTNYANTQFGSGKPFARDAAYTLVAGSYSISGREFEDTGFALNFADGSYSASSEAGTTNVDYVKTSLFLDMDGDGLLNTAVDLFIGSNEDNNPAFTFSNLPGSTAGIDYLVAVDTTDGDLTAGWTNTNTTVRAVTITTASVTDINFGFAPALVLDKALITADPRGTGEIHYSINVFNELPGDGTNSGFCEYYTWASSSTISGWGGVVANAYGAPNQVYSSDNYLTGGNNTYTGSGFSTSGITGNIRQVEAIIYFYMSAKATDDAASLDITGPNAATDAAVLSTDVLNSYAGTSGYGYYVKDVTGLGWTLADFTTTGLTFDEDKAGASDAIIVNLDAIGFKITTDNNCADPDTHMTDVPLVDTYNPAYLTFVTASPYPDSTTPAGTLTWNNIGTIYAGGAKTIQVYFTAVSADANLDNIPEAYTTDNDADVTNAYFSSGRRTNDASDTVPTTVNPGGYLEGYFHNDADDGNDLDASEIRFPNVPVYLCNTADCTGTIYQTTTTDANGYYRFGGLATATSYFVYFADADLPFGFGNGDGSYTPNLTNPNNNTENYGSTAGIILTDGNAANNYITNFNFGFDKTTSDLYGYVWSDLASLGAFNPNEPGISGVTVRLYTSVPPAACDGTGAGYVTSQTTNAVGYYEFINATASATHYICVQFSTVPATATQTGDPDLVGSACTTCDNRTTAAIVDTGGQTKGAYNFGYARSGSLTIGDTLFFDWDGDAVQDIGVDEGIPLVNIHLYVDTNDNGILDLNTDYLYATDETDIIGEYSFSNLPSGYDYLVVVDTNDPQFPSGAAQTKDPNESGICATCDNLSRHQNYAVSIDTVDFGYTVTGTGSLGDLVWFDRNGDGLQDGGQEVGLAGITVWLLADFNGDTTYATVFTTTTDANGAYLFENLPVCAACDYRVEVDTADPDLPVDAFGVGYLPSTAVFTDITLTTTVMNNGDNLDADFGFTALGAIGDSIFWDANGNGTQDGGEAGIGGVQVTLTNASPIVVNGVPYGVGAYTVITNTNASGVYLFSGLPAGSYTVSVDGPVGSAQTADPNSDGETCAVVNSDPDLLDCDEAVTVSVGPSQIFMGADFGYQPSSYLGDTIWRDQDADGVQDAGEYGMPGITVTLTSASAFTVDGVVYPAGSSIEVVTDAVGEWFLTNVQGSSDDQDFTLSYALPAGYTATYDPDGSGANGSAALQIDTDGTVNLGTACSNEAYCDSADFGLRISGDNQLSGTVCVDVAGDVEDWCGDGGMNVTDAAGAGETGASGQMVYLYRFDYDAGSDGIYEPDAGDRVTLLSSTLTASDGTYSFTNVPSVEVLISVGAPIDYADLNTVDGNRSDADVTEITTWTAVGEVTTGAYQLFDLTGLSGQNLGGFDFEFDSAVTYDYGDLPFSTGVYSYTTSLASNGPSHVLLAANTIYLGAMAPDAETDSAGTDLTAATDDTSGVNDDNGVTRLDTAWFNGEWDGSGASGGRIQVVVSGTLSSGWLVGWIDWNSDGDFNDEFDGIGEMVVYQQVNKGVNIVPIDIPECTFLQGTCTLTTLLGDPSRLYARFRIFSSNPGLPELAYSGPVINGEVEDYRLAFEPTAIELVRLHSSPVQVQPIWVALLALISALALAGAALVIRRKQI